MTYSRRQLYAMGEPLGDSATRKVAGKTIYGGGGGSSTPSSTTQTTTTIPEYARPYAERALGQAAALTDINQNPYQAYTGQRFAQFTPMQQQAFQGAYGMQTAGQLGTGTNLATAAGIGALGMAGSYDPYQTGQFTGNTAAQYMSPYMQNVTDIEKREAQRQSDIAGVGRSAQFTRAGAFGGGRQAIMDAEAKRNLAQQMGDIQAKGSQAAFQQGADQFNREQQLREQSRQYGAGLGMQGLQTATQAAGQLGQLGQQQFAQGMDINKLQQQYGTQQQSQVQNILSSQYQDFLNARQYPYQQLGFMSDILRGLPLSQHYSQTYQQPPSMMGQLAGIGMGAYAMGRKEGGSVHGYAAGGSTDVNNATPFDYVQQNEPVTRMAYGGDVTDDRFVEGAIRRLSTQQLQTAKQIALDRRDLGRVQEIDQELQRRNEIQSYSAGAAEEGMARGGVVAFSNGGTEGEFYQDPMGAPSAAAPSEKDLAPGKAIKEALQQEVEYNKPYKMSPMGMLFGVRGVEPKPEAGAGRGLSAAYKDYDTAKAAENLAKVPMRKEKEGKEDKGTLTFNEDSNARRLATAMATATGTSPKNMMGHVKEMYEWLKEGDKEMFEQVNARINEIKKEAKDVKEGAKMRALAQFGFQMAAAAAQPGMGRGIAGALRSAATAAPTISKSMAESDETYRRLMDTTNKLEIANLQANQQMQKGNKQGALAAFAQIRQLEAQQAQLAETVRHNKAVEGLSAQRVAAGNTAFERATMQTKERLTAKAQAQAAKDFSDPYKAAELRNTYPTQRDYARSLYKEMWADAMPQLQYLGTLGKD